MHLSKAVRAGLSVGLPGLLFATASVAAPVGGVVRAGTAAIAQSGLSTTITQATDRAVIDWSSFNIAANETVTFAQPGVNSAVLNRVTGAQFSSLQGALSANGQVFLVNPNGILIGNGATINVGSFFASTASISNAAFMRGTTEVDGKYAFNELAPGASTASIVNAGTITVADGGMVALVAPGVRNSGVITARLGTIELASATHFTLDLFGDDLVRLALGDSVAGSLVDSAGTALTSQVASSGQLAAEGGRIVLLSVPAAVGVVNDAINMSGVARAQSVGLNQRGEISLLANQGTVNVSANLDVSSAMNGVTGGDISMFGSTLHLAGGAIVNANGVGGGGHVTIGGKYSGETATDTAQTAVDFGALVSACGTLGCAHDGSGGAGDGGTIRLFSTSGTALAGELNISSAAANQAGTLEMLSDTGVTSMASMARIIGVTGENRLAGFIAVIGNTLDLAPTAFVDMSDVAGNRPDSDRRIIGASAPGVAPRNYVFVADVDPRPTERPILFHAFGSADYPDHLPVLAASGFDGPVGAVRPDGVIPTNLASTGADALAAIPVTFTTPPVTPTQPGGTDTLTAQVANTANGLTRDAADTTDAIVKAGQSDIAGDTPMVLVSGGPGVAQIADLGRGGAVTGASPDVFGANFHVLAPAGGADDTQVADYLCLTPFAANACRPKAP